jgi:hypothetical protein
VFGILDDVTNVGVNPPPQPIFRAGVSSEPIYSRGINPCECCCSSVVVQSHKRHIVVHLALWRNQNQPKRQAVVETRRGCKREVKVKTVSP